MSTRPSGRAAGSDGIDGGRVDGGLAGSAHASQLVPSSRFSVSLTSCGFALPFVAFITCPTKKPKSAGLAAAELLGLLRVVGDDLRADRLDAPSGR